MGQSLRWRGRWRRTASSSSEGSATVFSGGFFGPLRRRLALLEEDERGSSWRRAGALGERGEEVEEEGVRRPRARGARPCDVPGFLGQRSVVGWPQREVEGWGWLEEGERTSSHLEIWRGCEKVAFLRRRSCVRQQSLGCCSLQKHTLDSRVAVVRRGRPGRSAGRKWAFGLQEERQRGVSVGTRVPARRVIFDKNALQCNWFSQ